MALPWWQTWVRAAVMTASAAVIVAVGGPAVLRGDDDGRIHPVALTGTPSATAKATGARPSGSATAVRARPVTLALTLLVVPKGDGRTAPLVLRGTLLDAASGDPVTGAVTLWRKGRDGRWIKVLSDRTAAPDGTADFVVTQSGRTAVYRISAKGSGFRSATTRPMTVRRITG